MSAPLVVPFNFQPLSVSVKTGSYTIPAGRYAFISANLVGGSGIFQIDGNTAMQSVTNTTAQTTLSSSSLRAVNNSIGGAINPSLGEITNPSTGSGHSDAGAAFSASTATFTDVQISNGNFWVPTGTVLNVVSGQYVVTEYANIT